MPLEILRELGSSLHTAAVHMGQVSPFASPPEALQDESQPGAVAFELGPGAFQVGREVRIVHLGCMSASERCGRTAGRSHTANPEQAATRRRRPDLPTLVSRSLPENTRKGW
jgi:hypothetical protein